MRNFSAVRCLALTLAMLFSACSQAPLETPQYASEQQRDSKTLAVVDGQVITEEDLDIGGELMALEQQRYKITSRALENAIAERLLKAEAARRDISLALLLESEIDSKVAEPSDGEVEAFYEKRKQRIRGSLEEVRSKLVGALRAIKSNQLREEFVGRLREKSEVEIHLEPLRVAVELEGAPLRGPADAPVTIVEFSDFQCPFCKRVQPVIQHLRKRYAREVSWRFKDLPLNSIHATAQQAAEAARCAGEQGKFWEYHDALFSVDQITSEIHEGLAGSLGLASEPFLECLKSGKYREAVQADSKKAEGLGIGSTPTFVINGIILSGAQPLEEFARIIDSELRR